MDYNQFKDEKKKIIIKGIKKEEIYYLCIKKNIGMELV